MIKHPKSDFVVDRSSDKPITTAELTVWLVVAIFFITFFISGGFI